MRNVYQLTPLTRGKNILQQGNNSLNLRVNFTHTLGEKLPTNINHMNINHTTTKDVVVNFKKEKNQGEEKMKALRERMKEFDFTESFIEKVLKEYPVKKIEEKLELYADGRQVRNPVGWLMAALKEDYGEETEKNIEESPFQLKMDSRKCGNDIGKNGNEVKKILSREEAIKRIQEIRQNLMVIGNTNCQLERRKR